MTYISAIGTYLPRLRLARSGIAAATGWLNGSATDGKGSRSLAFWDEDSITMGVEAARDALAALAEPVRKVDQICFATTTPVFREPQQAVTLHAALRLAPDCLTQDAGGTARAGLLALQQALEHSASTLVVASDMPVHLVASAAQARAGDGAAAVLVGAGVPLMSYRGGASVAAPLVDHYQGADHHAAVEWEERWLREEGFLKLVPQAMDAALQKAGLEAGDIDWLVMPCTIAGCAAQLVKTAKLSKARLAPTLAHEVGDTGTGHAMLMLANMLPQIKAGERIMLAQCGQGATVLVLEAHKAVEDVRSTLPAQLASGMVETNYMKLLVFRGMVAWDRGLRGRQPVQEALSTAYRYHSALLGFVGGRCRQTGQVQFPPSRLAVDQGEAGVRLDTQDPYPLADVGGTVASFTADRLAFSRHSPNCYGLVDFNGGGRLMMDFTDPDADQLVSGEPVRFVFRIKDMDERTGYRRYFWKAVAARPVLAGQAE